MKQACVYAYLCYQVSNQAEMESLCFEFGLARSLISSKRTRRSAMRGVRVRLRRFPRTWGNDPAALPTDPSIVWVCVCMDMEMEFRERMTVQGSKEEELARKERELLKRQEELNRREAQLPGGAQKKNFPKFYPLVYHNIEVSPLRKPPLAALPCLHPLRGGWGEEATSNAHRGFARAVAELLYGLGHGCGIFLGEKIPNSQSPGCCNAAFVLACFWARTT